MVKSTFGETFLRAMSESRAKHGLMPMLQAPDDGRRATVLKARSMFAAKSMRDSACPGAPT